MAKLFLYFFAKNQKKALQTRSFAPKSPDSAYISKESTTKRTFYHFLALRVSLYYFFQVY